jgi:hypothetical protein
MKSEKENELEEVRRLAEENRKSIQRMSQEIQRLKRRLEGDPKGRDESPIRNEK